MSLINTSTFLPQAFQSGVNQRFLGATMDQLFSPAVNIPITGYVGRTFAPTYKLGDNYVPEGNDQRTYYQLEPSVVVTDSSNNIEFNSGYSDLLNNISTANGNTTNHQRLFSSTSYSYDGHFDYDKFVNYYNYYWLPNGPTAVDISANQVPYRTDYTVSRDTNVGGYVFSNSGAHPNVQLTLARGGTYTFQIDQPGFNFWLQSLPGVGGVDPNVPTLSTRNIFGATNNGTDSGTITFQVPLSSAQDFYINMPVQSTVDAAVDFNYTDIQNQLLSSFISNFPTGLDGIVNQLQNKTIIFINNAVDSSYWTTPTVPGAYASLPAVVSAKVIQGTVVDSATRPSTWKINLVDTGDGDFIVQLTPTTPIEELQRVFVGSGATYASQQFWLDKNLAYQTVPNITSIVDYLYYQDSGNPDFVGQIKLVNNSTSTININKDIIGSKGYVSPNGVVFTNGLKVQFDSYVTPSTYANKQYYVEGVGTGITLVDVTALINPEVYGSAIDTTPDYITVNRASTDQNSWSRYNRWFHKDVILYTATKNETTADYGPNLLARRPIIEFEANLRLFNYGQQAKPAITYITFAATDAMNDVEGKITASVDGVHLQENDRVVFANDYDNTVKSQVYQVHNNSIAGTNYITLVPTYDDPILAGENILVLAGNTNAGKTFYYDGTNWNQTQVKSELNQAPLFDVVDADGYSFSDSVVYPGIPATALVKGNTYQIQTVGTTDWNIVADTIGITYNIGDRVTVKHIGTGTGQTGFAGTKLFGYTVGTGTNDTVLGFPLAYINFNNIGDISFTNYYDIDSFTTTSGNINVSTGYMLNQSSKLTNWTPNIEKTSQFQVFSKFFEGYLITTDTTGTQKAFVQIDVLPATQTVIPHLKVYLNNKLLELTTDYAIEKLGMYQVVTFTNIPAVGDKIDVLIFSDTVSIQAGSYYEIPSNLDYNPLNENFNTITLGQIRSHYNRLIENTSVSKGINIPTQDNYLKQHNGTLVQHSSPLIYAMTFLGDQTVNFFDGLSLARKEYSKFKNKFLSLCSTTHGLDYTNPAAGVDTIMQIINAVKNSSFPWYYSDMVPQGGTYNELIYTVLNIRQMNYEINSIFDVTVLGNRAVLVYVNGEQQTLGIDYTFSVNSPSITFNRDFTIGDIISIRDYSDTDGNYIPETPTKLGLYPKFAPAIYLDNTYQTPVNVILGHDGSITPAFGDFRDDYLLELEKRIFNNIKVDYTKNQINIYDTLPGRFRTTDYSLDEYNKIISQDFLSWAGANKVTYITNSSYDVNNAWTWNYSQFPDRVDNSLLQGSWRAVYNHWFDTDTPNLNPWKMLGFNDKPAWWATRYGPSPYTSGNTLLWEDLERGYIWNGNNSVAYIDDRFARPGLTSFIPVNSAGNLLNPIDIPLFSKYNSAKAGVEFQFGQFSPAESAWRRSSDFPYAVQTALALTCPAKYFSTQFDTSKFYTNPATGQFSDVNNQRITPSLLSVNGDDTGSTTKRTSGYINWIGDSIKNLGMDPVTKLSDYFTRLNVQLNYKVAGFTDYGMLQVSAEQTSPGSTNGSVIIPDTNYKIYLNKSSPIASVTYSAVIVEKTSNGYSVSGYDPTVPFFSIIPSISNGNSETVTINNISVKVYQDSTNSVQLIPYGTEFATVQQVSDFIISYERYLKAIGFTFTTYNTNLEETNNWTLSLKELIYWAQQGWSAGTIIVLNPRSSSIQLTTTGLIVDEITNQPNQSILLDQNFVPIKSSNFTLVRAESSIANNQFVLSTLDAVPICFARLNLIQYEHVLVFDNVSDFGDIMYVPKQGTRQFRLKLSGEKTGAWSGALSASGYIYSDPKIDNWSTGTDYRTGDLVLYNNFYYTATKDIPASATFNNTYWTQIQKNAIQSGLLQNFSLNAQQFSNLYDVDNPPSNEAFQEYSAGLIGFRQRQYLTDLGISIPTQTKFYQGFIKEKGSLNSINALTKANFNNVNGNVNIYEEWAFNVGQYGGVNSNQFTEFVLDQSIFTTNPVAFTFANTASAGNIIVNLSSANIYNASNLSSTSTSLYANRIDTDYMTDVPTAGYVNIQDVDYTVFDINKFTAPLTMLGVGDKIWTAKNGNGQWDVLRVNETNLIAVSLTYMQDNYGKLLFDNQHNFKAGDSLVLKYFNPRFDGVYIVVSAPNPLCVVLAISTVNPSLTEPSALQYLIRMNTITGPGTIYSLNSARVNTVADLISYTPPQNGWVDNDRVWVDQNTDSNWSVYTYNHPWLSNTAVNLTGNTTTAGQFGSAVRISADNTFVFAGSPGSRQVFAKPVTTGSTITLAVADAGFGSAIDSQGNLLAVASNSNVYIYRQNGNVITSVQTITSANLNSNVTSISMSTDQNWLYIGGNNKVHVYRANTNPSSANVRYIWASANTGTGSFGNVVKTNSDGTRLFVGAPAATNTYTQNGNVYVYDRSGNVLTSNVAQPVISSVKNQSAGFGTSIDIDSTGGNLYIGAPGTLTSGYVGGSVERWTMSGGTYSRSQVLAHPTNDVGTFGISLSVSGDSQLLAVGSVGSSSDEVTTFDNNITVIDSATTVFLDHVIGSGATYIFETISNTYIYTQELEAQLQKGDAFGSSVDVTRQLIVAGAPGGNTLYGKAFVFANPSQATAWTLTRQQQPQVDIDSVARTLIYNKSNNNVLAALDFVDPRKGKVLNKVDVDIDYKLDADPALYNQGTTTLNTDLHWGPHQVGRIWWDLSDVRYIDYEQDALIYRLTHWGNRFPDSKISVYEWVESSVLPSQYTGTGTPLHADNSAYSTYGFVDAAGSVKVKYYFWVKGVDTVNTAAGKRNSVVSISAAIANPQSQGIPYATILRNDTIALHNVNNSLIGKNSVIHLGSQDVKTKIVHSEYALVQEGNPTSKLPDNIITKINDSLSGIDQAGNPVPDPALPLSQRYGIGIRPRQSIIVDVTTALYNLVSMVNEKLIEYPVTESKILTILNSEESAPGLATGNYSLVVNTFEELGYVDTNLLSVGYKTLVKSDTNNLGKWAIYNLTKPTIDGVITPTWTATQVQSYKTNLYWSYADWYDTTFDSTTTVDTTVANNLEFGKLTLKPNTYIKVLDGGNGKFIIYKVDGNLLKSTVGIQDGTIQFPGAETNIPSLELRQILVSIQKEIFINDLAKEYNKIFFTTIKYILTEQKNLDWVFKTSFISATQSIRKLQQFPSYIPDNQDFYLSYINEVKPYRTVVREFVVDYIGNDMYASDVTDFDLPPYWDSSLGIYRSPSGEDINDSTRWKSGVNSQWYNNHTHQVIDVIIENAGTGYTLPPQVIITGGGGTGATAYSELNGNGSIRNITIMSPGTGYTSVPQVTINGAGTGARGYAVLRNKYTGFVANSHNLVRSISTTIKFDRITYHKSNTFVFWSNLTSANVGQTIGANTIIVLNQQLYKLGNAYTINSNITFPVSYVTKINANSFNIANDRITAFNGNVNLMLTDDGIDYPGVIVDGNTYTSGTYDTTISSAFTTPFGIDPGNILVDGGSYVSTFSSHAPEELVPGRMFDTLDIRVFSNVAPDTNDYAFRLFDTPNSTTIINNQWKLLEFRNRSFYRIANANVTTLTSNLSMLDSNISIANASLLPEPNPTLAIPGVVFIDGEKITYYTRDTVNNVLGQIRRGVDGTGTPAIHLANTRVVDSSVQQAVLGANVSNVTISTSTTYNTTANVSYNLQLTGYSYISANIGDYITQTATGNSTVVANLRVLGNVTGATRWVPNLIVTTGTVISYNNIFYNVVGNVYGTTFANISSNVTTANSSITSTTSIPVIFVSGNIITSANTVQINGQTIANVHTGTYTVLGNVNSAGNVTIVANITSNVYVTQSQIWYNAGSGKATDGTGIINSTVPQAVFLKQSPGYKP